MGRDEKTTPDTLMRKSIDVEIAFGDNIELKLNSIHDEVILRILEDASNSGEPLKLIEKRIWDPKTKTAEFDINDSTILKLMYGKQPKK